MEENIYEIKIKIHEENELYNPLDPDKKLLSDEVISYIQQKYSVNAEIGKRPLIHILSDSPVNEKHVCQSFHAYIKGEINALNKEQHRTRIHQFRLFLIGIFFIAIWLYFAMHKENVFVEVLSIIGSFAVWEAADSWIVESPEIRLKKRRMERLDETRIKFTIN